MSNDIKFDLDKDIIMQIEMASYAEYNDTLAMMNDHLGEIYGYSNLNDVEDAQLHYEKELAYKAIKELQQEIERQSKAQVILDDMLANYKQENERLKERVAYLERSNNRREDTILSLRQEVYEQEDYKSRCEKANEYLDKVETLARLDGKIIFSINIFRGILQNGGDILNDKR